MSYSYGKFNAVVNDVVAELMAASNKFGPFNSAHEGYAVLAEEVDELWDEIKAKQGSRNSENLRKEASQVAAMAMRFIYDICDSGDTDAIQR